MSRAKAGLRVVVCVGLAGGIWAGAGLKAQGTVAATGSGMFYVSELPVPPQTYINTSMSATPVTGKTITVPPSGDLQGAIDAANPGDEIVLTAGATYTGNYVLRNKGGSGWIRIRTSAMKQLPRPGTRVGAWSTGLAKVVAAGVAPAFQTEPGAHQYRLIGLEMTVPPATQQNYGLVMYGDGTETTTAQLPSDIILDRVYIHGEVLCHCKRGVQMNGIRLSLIDSSVTEFHGFGQEAQAVAAWGAPGPLKIVNNELDGAGENILFGGAYAALPGVIQSDAEIRNNHLYKPQAWEQSVIPAPAGVSAQVASGGSLTAGVTYFYGISAYGTIGYITAPGLPGVMSGEVSVTASAGEQSAALIWNSVSYGDPNDWRAATQYMILRTTDPPGTTPRQWQYTIVPAVASLSQYSYTDVGNTWQPWTKPDTPLGPMWTVKNLLEFKNAQRVWVDGNVIENNWPNAQDGYAVLFTPRIEVGGTSQPEMTQNRVTDMMFTDNVVRNSVAGINIMGLDYDHPEVKTAVRTQRLLIRNNLLYEIQGPQPGGATGWGILITPGLNPGSTDLAFDHNTIVSEAFSVFCEPMNGTVSFVNTIFDGESIRGDGAATIDETLTQIFTQAVMTNSLAVGDNPATSPAGNWFPQTSADVGYTGEAAGDFQLLATSPYVGKAADGLDVGLAWTLLQLRTGSAVMGTSTPLRLPALEMLLNFKQAALAAAGTR